MQTTVLLPVRTITRHIQNIYKDEELDENARKRVNRKKKWKEKWRMGCKRLIVICNGEEYVANYTIYRR